MSLSFASLSFGMLNTTDEQNKRSQEGISGERIENIESTTQADTDKIGDEIGDKLLGTTREKAKASQGEEKYEELQKILTSNVSSLSELQQVMAELKEASKFCTDFVKEGVNCCTNADSCGGTSTTQKVANAAGVGGQALSAAGGAGGGGGGGGGAAGECLSALPGITSALGTSKGVANGCSAIRDGKNGQMGCTTMCSNYKELADQVAQQAQTLGQQEAQQNPSAFQIATKIRSEASSVFQEMSSGENTCKSSLSSGEQAANGQTAANGGGLEGLIQCLFSLLNGEETPEEEEQQEKTAVNCANPASAAENPNVCRGQGLARANNLALGKTQDLGLVDGGSESDLGDEEVFPDDRIPAGNGNAGVTPQATNTNAGGIGGGAGNGGGPSQKAGRGGRRGGSKGKRLVTGYRKTKGGGGGYGKGGKGKLSFNPFKFKKKKPKFNDKKALAALAALQKARIDPNVAGSIFERSTNRFSSSAVKYKLFDAPKNKTLWMRKK